MENWDPQMMLDLYIHNYLSKKKMHTTADIFAREAGFYPNPVAIDPPEGFLSEWWSLFWSIFSTKYPEHTKNGEIVPPNFNPAMLSPQFNHTLQNTCPLMPPPGFPYVPPTISPSTMQIPGIRNLFESGFPTMTPRPENRNVPGSDLRMMVPSPEFKFPVSNFNMVQGRAMGFSDALRVHDKGHCSLFNRDLSSNSPFLNADQLARMMPSSSNSSYPPERVYKNLQLRLARDEQCGTSFWRPTAAWPSRQPPNATGLKLKSVDTDSRRIEPERSRVPPRNSNFKPQINDVGRLLRLLPPSPINFSHPQENQVHNRPLLPVARDERNGAWSLIDAAEAARRDMPKANQIKIEPADTDARRMREQEHLTGRSVKNLNFSSQLLGVDRLSHLLPSSSNFSNPQKNKKRQLFVIGDNKCGTSSKRSTAEPTRPKPEIIDTGARIFKQGHFGRSAADLDSNSHLLGVNQVPLLLSSSSNFSHPRRNVLKRGRLPIISDGGCGAKLRRSSAPKPTPEAPKAIRPKIEPADTGSSTSSNSTTPNPSS